jgi:hypothetical protein
MCFGSVRVRFLLKRLGDSKFVYAFNLFYFSRILIYAVYLSTSFTFLMERNDKNAIFLAFG